MTPITPNAETELPALGSEDWTVWSEAVLAEAKLSREQISSRRWMVAHPDDPQMHALVAQIDAGQMGNNEVEKPMVIRWLSQLDGRVYILVEFFSLVRQLPPSEDAHPEN